MIRILLLLLASVGPGLLWLWFFYRQDRYEPEPLRMIVKIFLAGILLVLPAGLVEQFWRGPLMAAFNNGNWPSLLIIAFFVVALIEEGLKSLFLLWLVGESRELNEPVDGAIYGITLGLGFASLENFLWASIFGFGVAIMRALVTTLAHATFTGWVGLYIAKYKLGSEPKPGWLLTGFLIAFTGHGLYDFCLLLKSPLSSITAFILVGVLLWRLFQIIQIQVSNSPFRK